MNEKLENAFKQIDMTYQELVEIADSLTQPVFAPINQIVNSLTNTGYLLSIDQIRDAIWQLQIKAYELSEIKEKSTFRADLADAIQKERLATVFNGLDGSAAAKEKLALVEVSEEIVAETLYSLIANLFKTKLDQIHRLVDSLKSILASRMQELKFTNIGVNNDIMSTTNGNISLNNNY